MRIFRIYYSDSIVELYGQIEMLIATGKKID